MFWFCQIELTSFLADLGLTRSCCYGEWNCVFVVQYGLKKIWCSEGLEMLKPQSCKLKVKRLMMVVKDGNFIWLLPLGDGPCGGSALAWAWDACWLPTLSLG